TWTRRAPLQRKHGAELHPAGDRPIDHRRSGARRLARLHDLAPFEEAVPGAHQRMIEAPFVRKDVDEAEVDPVHRDRFGNGFETAYPAHLAKAAARLALGDEPLEREAARGTEVAAPFLGDARKKAGLFVQPHAAAHEQPLEIVEGERDIGLAA